MHSSLHSLILSFKFVVARGIRSDLLLPIFLLISYLIFLVLIRGVLPTADELITTFGNFYSKYGYEIIFASAFLESLILVNFFVPGQLAMALGVVFARTGQTELIPVIISVVLGTSLGNFINFILGYFGFSEILYKLGYGGFVKMAEEQIKKFGKRGLILGFIHSNVASFLSLTAGTIRMNWASFFMITILSTFMWTVLWSLLVYSLGDIVLVIIKKYTFLLVLLFLTGLILMRIWKKEEGKNVRRKL
jgi:membrane protein DedA with SNARE-associated domain